MSGVDLESLATLARAPGLYARHVRTLQEPFELLRLPADSLKALGVAGAARDWLRQPDPAVIARDVAWLERSATTRVMAGSAEYPAQLLALDDAPLLLYVRGRVEALHRPQLAMVGSRNPTAAGERTARQFAQHFARRGLAITSGLARGIDGASHEGALAGGGYTVAVCGTGLDRVYPQQHEQLAERIAAQGAVVSEFPPHSLALPHRFPRRNRIISGLARGILVVEAAARSGSFSTAGHALEQGRTVFAIPGSIHSPQSQGCNELLRQGAIVVTCADHVFQELDIPIENQIVALTGESPGTPVGAPQQLDKDYEMLLDALGFEPASVDMLVDRTGLPGESIASMLLILELAGHVEPRAGGTYSRLIQ